jgi:hypothetical protein
VSDCIIWGGPFDRDGYGRKGKRQAAHRAAYEEAHGPIPAGHQVDHRCHSESPDCPGGIDCLHRKCVNPDHLEAVTPFENNRRMKLRRPTCRRGHEWTPENTRLNWDAGRGFFHRQCKECRNIADRARRQRKQAAA